MNGPDIRRLMREAGVPEGVSWDQVSAAIRRQKFIEKYGPKGFQVNVRFGMDDVERMADGLFVHALEVDDPDVSWAKFVKAGALAFADGKIAKGRAEGLLR